MNVTLKAFQRDARDRLVAGLRYASKQAGIGELQAVSFASPTGSGKTLVALAAIETLLQGDDEFGPNPHATFLWISDQPELNEQTRRKMLSTSTFLDQSRLIVIDSAFDAEIFASGVVYFLNIQKLGREKQLITHGDERSFTLWDTINNTIQARPASFFVFIDEAHRGMHENLQMRKEAASIIQRFIKGSPEEIRPTPLIVGISATPERFLELVDRAERVTRSVVVEPQDVRASGLLKDIIVLYHPLAQQPDLTMLQAAVGSWQKYCAEWEQYSKNQNETAIRPILTVQVLDRSGKQITKTDLPEAIRIINQEVGQLPSAAFAHSFQEGRKLLIDGYELRYLAPSDIENDPDVQIVFFKTSLNTGWDCPRAEVMMSFRTAADAVYIAQLVGRMVRSPLARRIQDNEHLNSVALFLPHYDEQGLDKIIKRLTEPEPDVMPDVLIKKGEDVLTLNRAAYAGQAFSELEKIPSYVIPKARKVSQVKRLMKLTRLLAQDSLCVDADEEAKETLLAVLRREYDRNIETNEFRKIIEQEGRVKIRSVNLRLNGVVGEESEIEERDLASEDIEDLFEFFGRKLGGEGLHKAWWKDRVNKDYRAKKIAKLELVALCLITNAIQELESEAQQAVQRLQNQYKTSTTRLPEVRKQAYNEIYSLAMEPEETRLSYPSSIQGYKEEQAWHKHLFVDDDDLFYATFNSWETSVVETELKRQDIVGWLRNQDRKDWSLCIPYEIKGEPYALYPDFLFLRSQDGKLIVDILDPHRTDVTDASHKAKGLAKYAQKHGHEFGRIELITVKGKKIRRLDVCDERIRKKVLDIADNQQLQQLFDEA